MNVRKPGLRERKRAQARRRMEEAAISLVLEHGLDQVTVDAISERADVSPRTFFNYFDSKEDAILGVLPMEGVTDQLLAEHRARYGDADLVESIVGLVFAVLGPAIADPAFREARMRVIRENPQLLGRQLSRMARMTEQLTAAVRTFLDQPGDAMADAPTADAVAETMLAACGGAIRAAARQWAATNTDISLQELEERAVALVRETMVKLK